MEDVVGSVFDLMRRTADPLQEEEVIGERVDIIFEVHQMTGLVTREKENDVKTRGNANGGDSLQPVFGNEQRFAYSLQSPFKKGPAPETGLSSSG